MEGAKRLYVCLILLVLIGTSLISVMGKTYEGNQFLIANRWAKVFGGPKNEWKCYIRQTYDGGYLVVTSTESFGAGGYDIWLIKLNRNGEMEWNKTTGGRKDEFVSYLLQTSDQGLLIVANTNSYGSGGFDGWLIKLDKNCNEEWNKTIGGKKDEWLYYAQQTSDGGFIIAGETGSYHHDKYSGGLCKADAWLIKTDQHGNEMWNVTFGRKGKIMELFRSVQQTSDGGYIACGVIVDYRDFPDKEWIYLVKTDKNGNEEWNRTYNFSSDWGNDAFRIFQTEDGGYVMLAEVYVTDYLFKLNESGEVEWKKEINVDKLWYTHAVTFCPTRDGGYVIVGYGEPKIYGSLLFPFFVYRPVIWMMKLDKDFETRWVRTYPAMFFWSGPFDVCRTRDGGYVIGGIASPTEWNFNFKEQDIIVIKTGRMGRTNPVQLKLCGILHWLSKGEWPFPIPVNRSSSSQENSGCSSFYDVLEGVKSC